MAKTILTVGNIYIDHNVFGVETGETFHLESGKDYFGDNGDKVLGGSAVNAALQMKNLGLTVGFIGKTGTDDGAKEVRSLLKENNIISDLMSEDSSRITSMAINLIDKKGEFIGVHYGNASKVLSGEDINLNHPLFKETAGIYFGGTTKQPLVFKDCENIFKALAEKNIKVFYDPNRFPVQETSVDIALFHAQLPHVEIYFPNEDELLQATGASSVDEALITAKDSGVKIIALKLGAKGCRIVTKDEDFTVEGRKVTPKTTVGAGDCFNATFISYYLNGSDLRTCAEKATIAASIKVSRNIWPNQTIIDQN